MPIKKRRDARIKTRSPMEIENCPKRHRRDRLAIDVPADVENPESWADILAPGHVNEKVRTAALVAADRCIEYRKFQENLEPFFAELGDPLFSRFCRNHHDQRDLPFSMIPAAFSGLLKAMPLCSPSTKVSTLLSLLEKIAKFERSLFCQREDALEELANAVRK